MQKLLTFFQQKYANANDRSFNDTSTNSIVSFEQLGPDIFFNRILLIFFLFLYENICCGYSLEALLMRTTMYVYLEK